MKDTHRAGHPLLFRLLRLTLLPWVLRETIQRRRPTLLVFHDPDPATFERILRTLARRYRIVPLRALVEALRAGSVSSLPPKSLIITLDDGYRGNADLLGVLERLGTPVTIFVCAAIVGTKRHFWFQHVADPEALKTVSDPERVEHLRREGFEETGEEREALSEQEMRRMAGSLVDFQSHGLTHPILTACDDAKARAEVIESRRALAERFGLDAYAFSYPNGDYGERELELAREAGYACALTARDGFVGPHSDPYQLPRIGIDDAAETDELLVKASGLWGVIRRLRR